jgi:hypothetical protein
LEAKHYRGVIHAEADAPRWTQAFSTVRHTFQNPRWQNYPYSDTSMCTDPSTP